MNTALLSSERMDWCTPESVLEKVRQVAPIRLDPSTNADNPTNAAVYYTHETDGLSKSWAGDHGLVFVNPEYGRALKVWSEKIVKEARGAEIIALVPSRTDTKWFHHLADNADMICFWRGRITFVGAAHPAPFPSAVFYFGPNVARFMDKFQSAGLIR